MRIYSFSRLQAFLTCARKFKYKYVDGWEVQYDGPPLPVGKATHSGIDALYLGASTEEAVATAQKSYWDEIGPVYERLEPREQKNLDNGWVQVEAMLSKYLETSEEMFVIPMGHDRALKGIIDRRMKVNGDLWVHDTKTSGMDLQKVLKVHRLRKQFALYKLIADEEYKVGHIGVMLDLIHKPRVYNRKDGTNTVGDVAYHREPLHISDRMVDEARGWFHHIAELIETNEAALRPASFHQWPMNTDSCLNFNRVCPYFECCRMPTRATQLLENSSKFKQREEVK